MIKVLKICGSEWTNASRDIRELTVCRELGADVVVMAKGNPGDNFKKDEVSSFVVLRFSTRPLGSHMPKSVNRFVSLFTWARDAKKLVPDVISGHDLTGLFIGWMSNFGRKKKAKLVYDSHEFEIGRSGKRSFFAKWFIKHLEHFLIKRCVFSIMVNDSIANEVQRIHKLKDRPVVVRNIPPFWIKDNEKCACIRKRICLELAVPEDSFIVMYHGGVMRNRGIENLLNAIAMTSDVSCVILGNGETTYLDTLKKQAIVLGIGHRVLFHPAVNVDNLMYYVGAVDCGMVTVPNTCVSYYYMLPNKFFENIQSETPIIGSSFPEISRLVNQYDIGLLCDSARPDDIKACIQKLHEDKVLYERIKDNLKIAKHTLCWEEEKHKISNAYRLIF